MKFPAKKIPSYIWVAIPVDWVTSHWYAFGADGRAGGRTDGRKVTWLQVTTYHREGDFRYKCLDFQACFFEKVSTGVFSNHVDVQLHLTQSVYIYQLKLILGSFSKQRRWRSDKNVAVEINNIPFLKFSLPSPSSLPPFY